MADLFADAAEDRLRPPAPLADRLRPRDLDEVAGQEHLLGPGAALRRPIEEDRVGSSIFHGPPGTGKTTVARLIAGRTGAAFEELSAVNAGKADVQAVIARARDRLGGNGQRTILFLDEIHRFNKAQQDALLPVVESGLVTLIGATTENPYHDVIGALLSRCRLYEFRPLDPAALDRVVDRGAAALGLPLTPEVREAVVACRRRRRAHRARRRSSSPRSTPARAATPRPRGRGRGRQAPARPLRQVPATGTTTRSRPSSRACAGATPTPRSTTWRR